MGRVRILKWAVGFGLLAVFTFAGWYHSRSSLVGSLKNQEPSVHSAGPSVTSQESPATPSSANTLIFAGLSGQPPKFIDSGPERGLGWLEYHTQEIRKGLKQDGFDIQMEYMTPARIAHEFRVQSPICFYPTEWNNPKEVFKQKPDRIYSIPLDLGDEVSQSVMLRKEDLPKFKKHQDSQGNINLESLFQDKSLKTLLVRDKDYGRFSQHLTEVNAQGEQVVRPEYTTHVMLLVVRDNRQIAQMLDAGRFDYTVSAAVEAEDLSQSKIETSRFAHLNVVRTGARDKRDPQLKFVSVACSPHPLAIRAMPFINRWIDFYRGSQWKHLKVNYQIMVDSKVPKFLGNLATLVHRFRGEFSRGELDFWYSDQQKFFPSLKLFPERVVKESQEASGDSRAWNAERASQEPKWSWFTDSSGAVTVFSEALPYFQKGTTPSYEYFLGTLWAQRFLPDLLLPFLNLDQGVRLGAQSHFEEVKTGLAFEAIPFLQVEQTQAVQTVPRITRAVFFAHPLTLRQAKRLREWIQSSPLEELSIFGASSEVMQAVLPVLPKSLTSLNLTGSSLLGTSSPEGFNRLKKLHLSDCQISEPQMANWLQGLPLSLEELSLGYNRVAWSARNVLALSRLQLPNLRLFDLENSALTSKQLSLISKVLSPKLEVLRLGWNFFSPAGLKSLFARPLPRLIDLDLSQSRLPTDAPLHRFQFPPSLKKLVLNHSVLSGRSLQKMVPLEKLEFLDLGTTHLEDEEMALLFEGLGESLVSLRISQGRMGAKSMEAILKNARLKNLERLSLDGNVLGNADVVRLTRALPKVKRLSLSRNRISDLGVQAIAETWMPSLEELDLSHNPITEKGTQDLALRFGKDLKALFLTGLLSIDFGALAPKLPDSLVSLSLGGNQVSNLELDLLAPHLPKSLQYLDLSKSIFTEAGARRLASALAHSSSLRALDLDTVPLGAEGMLSIVRALPRSLTSLRIGFADFSRSEAEQLGKSWPKGLLDLFLRRLSGSLAPLFESLPNSITQFRIHNSQVERESAVSLSQHWPKGLRELYLEGLGFETSVSDQSPSRGLPLGLERLALSGTSQRMDVLGLLGECSQLFFLQLYQTSTEGRELRSIFKKCTMLQEVELTGLQKVSKADWSQLSRMPLPPIKLFDLTNFNGSNPLVLDFARNLSSDSIWFDFSFLGLTDEVVKPLLGALSSGLIRLNLQGNPLGQNGLDLLRAYQAKRQKEDGFIFEVGE